MNLKTRFVFLILGAIFIPLLVMGVSLWNFKHSLAMIDPALAVQMFEENIVGMESPEDFETLKGLLGNRYFAVMTDIPEHIESSDDSLMEGDPLPRVVISSRIHTFPNGEKRLIVHGMSLNFPKAPLFPFFVIISSLAALILMSLIIIRSINKSIEKLEQITGKIADGDLDVEIETHGKDKFASLARSLDTMRQQIKLEYDRRNRFFMGISHDLKTPLASITGYADALLEGMADNEESMHKYLNIIKDKSHQLETRITHLIHYMKLSNYDFQASLKEQPLAGFLQAFMEARIEEAEFQNRVLVGDIRISSELKIPFDEDLVSRALENLISNAFRYGSPHKAVGLYSLQNQDLLEIMVENDGKMIPADQLSHLFEPFFRGDKSRRSDGFGLGLSSVKSIVESHGWSIRVESSSEKTRFIISILLTTAAAAGGTAAGTAGTQ